MKMHALKTLGLAWLDALKTLGLAWLDALKKREAAVL
jgi:hypothetical protein